MQQFLRKLLWGVFLDGAGSRPADFCGFAGRSNGSAGWAGKAGAEALSFRHILPITRVSEKRRYGKPAPLLRNGCLATDATRSAFVFVLINSVCHNTRIIENAAKK